VKAFKKADTGLVVLEGQLIEKPVIRHMERVLAISKKLSKK
jgi:citrate lyase beta subunit